MHLGQDRRRGLPRDMRDFLAPPVFVKTQLRDTDLTMRKEFMVIAAVVAVALVGYLSWQSANEAPVVQTSAPPASTAATPPAAAPQNTPAPADPAAPAQPAQPSQPAQQ